MRTKQCRICDCANCNVRNCGEKQAKQIQTTVLGVFVGLDHDYSGLRLSIGVKSGTKISVSVRELPFVARILMYFSHR